MSLFWLAYRQGETAGVMIVEAASLIHARLKTSLAIDGLDAHFVRGFELEPGQKVPADKIGRLLDQVEAARLLKSFERQIPKKRAAASIRRSARKVRGAG